MDIEAIKALIDENILKDEYTPLSEYTPKEIDLVYYVMNEIRFQVNRAYYQQQKQFLMS